MRWCDGEWWSTVTDVVGQSCMVSSNARVLLPGAIHYCTAVYVPFGFLWRLRLSLKPRPANPLKLRAVCVCAFRVLLFWSSWVWWAMIVEDDVRQACMRRASISLLDLQRLSFFTMSASYVRKTSFWLSWRIFETAVRESREKQKIQDKGLRREFLLSHFLPSPGEDIVTRLASTCHSSLLTSSSLLLLRLPPFPPIIDHSCSICLRVCRLQR